MTLLITGATGHVAGELLRQAVAAGRDVVALHRGAPPADTLGARWLQCDLADPAAIATLAETLRVDACIHAAAISNEAYARPDPLAAIATNVGATASLLDAARRHAWRRLVLVSTGSVFQRRADLVTPILEDEPPAPGNVYGTTKTAAETLLAMYRRELGLDAATVRISWVYGPPVVSLSPARGPIPSMSIRALKGEPIHEPGGDFAASFTHVSDVAAGLLALADAPTLRHDTYHLGHGVNFTAHAVAAALRAVLPSADIALTGGTEPWTRYTAIRAPLAGTRMLKDTGFSPRVSLEQGIAGYVEWLKQQ